MPSTSTSTVSPTCMGPMPDGVPVAMTSPASRVMTWLTQETTNRGSKMSCAVVLSCFTSPLRRLRRASPPTSPGAVSIHGPQTPNVSKPLARVHWPSFA